ncbi:MAG: MFS transporter [Planctomycetes bacterium]|nr:MFS transporter [Planctomycetota bacterium]
MAEAYEQLRDRHFRHNFVCHLFDGIFALAAFSAIGVTTFLPCLVEDLTRRQPELEPYRNRLAALMTCCFFGLTQLSAFLFAGYFEGKIRRKHILIWATFIARLGYVVLLLATVYMFNLGFTAYLAVLYASLCWFAIFNGVTLTLWMDFIAQQIPDNRRGILFGLRDCFGNLLGAAIIASFPFLTKHLEFPHNYAVVMAAVCVLIFLSLAALGRMREVPYDGIEDSPSPPLLTQIVRSLQILRDDSRFAKLMIAILLLGLGGLASLPLYTLKAVKVLAMNEQQRADFFSLATILCTVSYAAAIPLAGMMGDRLGYKKAVSLMYPLLIASFIIAAAAGSLWIFCIAIVLAGIAQAGVLLTMLSFPLEFAPQDRRPSYMAVRCLFVLPQFLTPFLGGWLADKWGYTQVFVIAGICVAVGLAFMHLMVADPRLEKQVRLHDLT